MTELCQQSMSCAQCSVLNVCIWVIGLGSSSSDFTPVSTPLASKISRPGLAFLQFLLSQSQLPSPSFLTIESCLNPFYFKVLEELDAERSDNDSDRDTDDVNTFAFRGITLASPSPANMLTLQNTRRRFLSQLLTNLEKRFPTQELDILCAFGIFDPKMSPHKTSPLYRNYGVDEINRIAKYYCKGKLIIMSQGCQVFNLKFETVDK